MCPMRTWTSEVVPSATFNQYVQNQVVAQFTDVGQRDGTSPPGWASPPDGATCYCADSGWWRRQAGAWVLQIPAAGVPYAAGTLNALTSVGAASNNPISAVTVAGGITAATPTLTVPVAGRYLITATMNFSANSARAWFFAADAGSVNLLNSSTAGGAGYAANLAGIVTLTASGQIKFMVNASAFPISTTIGAGLGLFNVVYLGG